MMDIEICAGTGTVPYRTIPSTNPNLRLTAKNSNTYVPVPYGTIRISWILKKKGGKTFTGIVPYLPVRYSASTWTNPLTMILQTHTYLTGTVAPITVRRTVFKIKLYFQIVSVGTGTVPVRMYLFAFFLKLRYGTVSYGTGIFSRNSKK